MNNDVNNILPHNNDADKEKLLQQLNNDIFSDNDDIDNQFETDANIGLQQIGIDKANKLVNSLNTDLSKHLYKKKKRRGIFNDPSNIYITIITILLLIIIGYLVIRKMMG